MAPKGQTRLESDTKLALVRHHARVPQVDMARRMGVSIATYQRLEEGRMPNPPLGYLVNAAIVLRVPVAALIEREWLSWWDFGAGAQAPSPRRNAPWS
ncbi:MAG: helix-turn-helix domain-containing protein [Solirubrobacteraceae bacterium]